MSRLADGVHPVSPVLHTPPVSSLRQVPVEVRPADAADVDVLFEVFRDVVASGGAEPPGGRATREVFVEGWVRERQVYAARQNGVTVGGYSFAATSRRSPHTSPKAATWSRVRPVAVGSAATC